MRYVVLGAVDAFRGCAQCSGKIQDKSLTLYSIYGGRSSGVRSDLEGGGSLFELGRRPSIVTGPGPNVVVRKRRRLPLVLVALLRGRLSMFVQIAAVELHDQRQPSWTCNTTEDVQQENASDCSALPRQSCPAPRSPAAALHCCAGEKLEQALTRAFCLRSFNVAISP